MSDPSPPPATEGARLRDAILALTRSPRVGSVVEGLVAFCALLVLRHADEQEAEDEALAVFEDAPFHPSLTVGVRWRELCQMEPEKRRVVLRELPAFLRDSEDRGPGALARRVAESLVRTHVDDRVAAFEVVQGVSLASIFERHAVLDALDAVLYTATRLGEGAHWTPPPLARWMIDLAEPPPSARVYDPCFGVGTLLAEVARRRSLAALESPGARTSPAEGGVFGVELDAGAYAIGLARVILAGEDRPSLELGDALARPLPSSVVRDGFDVILAQVPFGMRHDPAAPTVAEVRTSSVEGLFVQRVMASLRPQGHATVLLPAGFGFQGGALAEVRRALFSRFEVRAVVELPGGALAPYTMIGTLALSFAHAPPRDHVSVLRPQIPEGRTGLQALAVLADAGAVPLAGRSIPIRSILASRDATIPPAIEAPSTEGEGGPTFADFFADPTLAVPRIRLGDFASIVVLDPSKLAPSSGGKLARVITANEVANGMVRVDGVEHVSVPFRAPFPLRAGDVVLALRDDRLDAAVVSNGAVGAIAPKPLVAVRLPEGLRTQLSPSFLARLLSTPEAHRAFAPVSARREPSARSRKPPRAPTLLAVSTSLLADLEIPVPPLAIQERVLREATRDNFFEALRALCRPAGDPLVVWLGDSSAVAALSTDPNVRDTRSLFEVLAIVRDDVLARLASETSVRHEPLRQHLVEVARALEGVDEVPFGWMRLAVLQSARLLATQHWSTLRDGYAPNAALPVVAALRTALAAAAHRCAEAHRIELARHALLRRTQGGAEFALTFANSGAIGVHALRVEGAGFRYVASSLGAGEETTFSAAVSCADDAREVALSADVSGRRLDGEAFSERLTLTLDLRASSPDLTRPLDASPYVTGASLTRAEMVYGRDPIFDDLARLFASPHAAPLVLLEGSKRVGKTSIMNQLLAARAPAGYVVSYATLQGAEGRSEGAGLTDREVWLHVAQSVGDALVAADLVVPPPETVLDAKPSAFARKLAMRRALSAYLTADHPFDAFVTWVDLVLEALGARRLLVMIDEFDKLQEGVEAGVTSPQLVENLRALYLQRPTLGFVIAGGRRLARLRTEYFSALFGVGHRITVGPLPDDAARALVTEPVKGQLQWLPDARDEVVRRCAGHPFLIQAVCNQVFLRAAREDERRIGLPFVERAIDEAVDGMDHFPTLWKQVATPRRQLLLALCALDPRRGESRDIGVLEEELAQRGVPVPDEGIGADLAALDELELIALETEGVYQRYRLRLPIFAAWVQNHVDLAALAREAARQE